MVFKLIPLMAVRRGKKKRRNEGTVFADTRASSASVWHQKVSVFRLLLKKLQKDKSRRAATFSFLPCQHFPLIRLKMNEEQKRRQFMVLYLENRRSFLLPKPFLFSSTIAFFFSKRCYQRICVPPCVFPLPCFWFPSLQWSTIHRREK